MAVWFYEIGGLMDFSFNLGRRFEAVATRNSEAIAIAGRGADPEDVTYAELHSRVERIASWLQGQGLKKGAVVGLFHDKSADAYATMLASLRLGLVYTILDPASPWARLEKILATCSPQLILGFVPNLDHAASCARVEACDFRDLGRHRDELHGITDEPTTARDDLTGADPAYIMFTSGSTGTPKGAVMSHGNVLNFVDWAVSRFDLGPDDRMTNVNPMYFDNSVFDFYGSLFSGATLVPFSGEETSRPRQLADAVNAAGCTVWFSVPSLLVYLLTTRALEATDFPVMRKIVFGGEGFPKPKLRQLYELFGDRVELENVYGPTECTCICSAHRVRESDFEDMTRLTTLGKLAPNFDYEILASDPKDPQVGELFLRGPNVGLGYYNDPERTAATFVQNPRHSLYSDIGYRTGDLVAVDTAGNLHFRGRTDFQIKHMGYRIELEEIEAALATAPGVRECAATYRRLGDGLGEIVGHVAAEPGTDASELTAHVRDLLPAYMVPRRIRLLDSLPKNRNGKIDRKRLDKGTEETG